MNQYDIEPGELIRPNEMAKALGFQNSESIRRALERGTYPIGFAIPPGPGGKWIYVVPRKPFMEFVRTGKFPETTDTLSSSLILKLLQRLDEVEKKMKIVIKGS